MAEEPKRIYASPYENGSRVMITKKGPDHSGRQTECFGLWGVIDGCRCEDFSKSFWFYTIKLDGGGLAVVNHHGIQPVSLLEQLAWEASNPEPSQQ